MYTEASLIEKNDYDLKFYRQAVAIFHKQLVDVIKEEVVIDVRNNKKDNPISQVYNNSSSSSSSSGGGDKVYDIMDILSSEVNSIDAVLSGRKNSHELISSSSALTHEEDVIKGHEEEDVSSKFTFHSDRSGFGGHNAFCKGYGGMSLEKCELKLLSVRTEGGGGGNCDALSYKDGQCYVHNSKSSDFYSDNSMGHQFLELSST
jgi:hypothetical protein